jgi:hypothetical protein
MPLRTFARPERTERFLENNVLFPRAVALEHAMSGGERL